MKPRKSRKKSPDELEAARRMRDLAKFERRVLDFLHREHAAGTFERLQQCEIGQVLMIVGLRGCKNCEAGHETPEIRRKVMDLLEAETGPIFTPLRPHSVN